MAAGGVDCGQALGCWKPPLHAATTGILSSVIKGEPTPLDLPPADPNKFIIAFCGSGTGHLIQALSVAKMMQKQGMVLVGVVADSDANERMLKDMVMPLGVEVLTIPSITLVDGEKGMVLPPLVLRNTLHAKKQLMQPKLKEEIVSFLSRTNAGMFISFWHITFAYFLQLNPVPPSIKVLHIAAQFAHTSLDFSQLPSPIEVVSKATMEFMAGIFSRSGHCVTISPREIPNALPPILEVPKLVESMQPRIILCYFLVQADAIYLEKLLAKHGTGGAEFHCFTSKKLPEPKGRPLALNSYPKQRALFQELFSKCTGAIVSTGNETIWEAVCRGVPVLTIPTAEHGEQLLNSTVHSANFPNLVRARKKIYIEDVRWVTEFEPKEEAVSESLCLRRRVTELIEKGSPILSPPTASTSV